MNINLNEKQSQSQNKKIIAHLKAGKSITQLEALKKFNCFRLSARIKDLKDSGYAIESQFVTLPSGKRVKEYFMVEAD